MVVEVAGVRGLLLSLNESPSKKEGKSGGSHDGGCAVDDRLNESPSKKDGKSPGNFEIVILH